MNRLYITLLMLFALCGCINKAADGCDEAAEESLDVYGDCQFNETYDSMEEAEQKLIKVLLAKYGDPEDNYQNMHYGEITDFILKEPRSLDYPFTALQEKGFVSIHTSADGNLRLYYWNNGSGGTCISWSNICQYRSNGEVYSYVGAITDVKYDCFAPKDFVSDCAVLGIRTLYDDDNVPLYLVHAYVRESGNWGYSSVEAVRIADGKIVAAPVFSGNEDIYSYKQNELLAQCYRDIEYRIAGWYFRANDGEGWDWQFRYDNKSNILYLPRVDYENSDLSDRYSLYKFNGKTLDFIGVDGGFWLHPSLRSFEYLELILVTKSHRVRVDRMYDGTYRYASWNHRATMDNLPDIILYGGLSDEEHEEFHFRSGNFEYIVSMQELIVKRDGKEVSRQGKLEDYDTE